MENVLYSIVFLMLIHQLLHNIVDSLLFGKSGFRPENSGQTPDLYLYNLNRRFFW